MKTRFTFYSLVTATLMASGTMIGEAQTRDSQYSNARNRTDDDRRRDDRNDNDYRDNDNYRNNHYNDSYSSDRRAPYNDHDYRSDNGNHYGHRNHHDNVIVTHSNRPRYIYYRDYDVYYDCRNNAYISHTGRQWVVTPTPPGMYRHVNWRNVRGYEVNYWDDDFHRFLERRRPGIGREYRGW